MAGKGIGGQDVTKGLGAFRPEGKGYSVQDLQFLRLEVYAHGGSHPKQSMSIPNWLTAPLGSFEVLLGTLWSLVALGVPEVLFGTVWYCLVPSGAVRVLKVLIAIGAYLLSTQRSAEALGMHSSDAKVAKRSASVLESDTWSFLGLMDTPECQATDIGFLG